MSLSRLEYAGAAGPACKDMTIGENIAANTCLLAPDLPYYTPRFAILNLNDITFRLLVSLYAQINGSSAENRPLFETARRGVYSHCL